MPHAHASGFPSPCLGRNGKRPWLAGGFSRRSDARGEKNLPLTVGLGPSDATRAGERVSLAVPRLEQETALAGGWFFAQIVRSRGTGPRATDPEGVLLATRRSGAGAPELQSPQGP